MGAVFCFVFLKCGGFLFSNLEPGVIDKNIVGVQFGSF